MVKNPHANAGNSREAQPLGWEDPLEEEMAPHSSILAWKIKKHLWIFAIFIVSANSRLPTIFVILVTSFFEMITSLQNSS